MVILSICHVHVLTRYRYAYATARYTVRVYRIRMAYSSLASRPAANCMQRMRYDHAIS